MSKPLFALMLAALSAPALAQTAPLLVDQHLTHPNDIRYFSLVCRSADKDAVKWADVRNVVLRQVDAQRILYFTKGVRNDPVTYLPAAGESCETFLE